MSNPKVNQGGILYTKIILQWNKIGTWKGDGIWSRMQKRSLQELNLIDRHNNQAQIQGTIGIDIGKAKET
jgi:hypothetical protein